MFRLSWTMYGRKKKKTKLSNYKERKMKVGDANQAGWSLETLTLFSIVNGDGR